MSADLDDAVRPDAPEEPLPEAPEAREQAGVPEPEPDEAPADLELAAPDESGQAETKLIYRLSGKSRLDMPLGTQRERQGVSQMRSSSSTGSLQRQLGLAAAYIHDDFEQQDFTSLASDPLRRTTKRLLPPHLVFDITRTQVASSQTRQRARVATPSDPVRGYKNEAAAARFPDETYARPGSRAGSLAPMKASSTGRKSKQASLRPQGKAQGQRDEADARHPRPHTSLGLARGADEAADSPLSVGANSAITVDTGARVTLADLKTSWTMSGAGSMESIEEPPELKASRMLMTMPPGTKYKYDPLLQNEKKKSKLARLSSQNVAELSTLDEVNRTRREYKEEISRPDGTPIPSNNRKWPHIVLDTINNNSNERAIGILSVVRKYKYIENSPSHTKAFALSQRGYVEQHKKGLTEFEPMPELNVTMMQYAMAKKQPLFSMFREYKALRHWDFAVRRRKFNDRKAIAERKLLQARREHWACVQHVMSACVQLTLDVQEKELRAPPTGWSVEQLRDEILRRREILQDALDSTRQRITNYLERFFSSISEKVSVEKMREIYKQNRVGNEKKALQIASEDMMLLARLYCLCEHIMCQTATQLYNNEVARVLRLLKGQYQSGVLNVDASMFVSTPMDVKIELPHTELDVRNPKNVAEIRVVPSGSDILEMLTSNFNTLCASLAFSMRPRLIHSLEKYIASEVFLPFASKKPDYSTQLTHSVEYLDFHDSLVQVINSSHSASIDHCSTTMGHLRVLFAYMEGFSVRSAEEKRALIDKYPQEVEQYAQWGAALVKMPVQDYDSGALRVKYRRIKMQMQDKLQQEVVDARFDMFFETTSNAITDLTRSGKAFTEQLKSETRTFDDLVSLLNTSKELDRCMEDFVHRVQVCLQNREVLIAEYKTTSSFIQDPASKKSVPFLNPHLADKMREERQMAQMRMIQNHEENIGLVKRNVAGFTKDLNGIQTELRSVKVQQLSSSSETALSAIQGMKTKITDFETRKDVIGEVLEYLKLPALNMNTLKDIKELVESLDELWKGIAGWRAATSEMLDTPIKVLQGIDVEKRVTPVLEQMARLAETHHKIPLAQELANDHREFSNIWPSIRRLANKAMQKAHFDEFLKGDSTELVHIDLSTVTVRQLQKDRHLEKVEKLTRLHNKAVEEEQMFALVDKLRVSIDNKALNVRREGDITWVEGLVETASLIQDDAMLISSIHQTEFRKMVKAELESLGHRNNEAGAMVSRLRFCQESWNALRVAHAGKNLKRVDTETYEQFVTAEGKWIKAVAALSMERGQIGLRHVEFAHVLRVQEVMELFTKCTEQMHSFYDYLSSQCWRLRYVPMMEALHITGMFLGPGPSVQESVLVRAFPSMHAIKVNTDHQPELITGAHTETLQIRPSQGGPSSWIETVQNFLLDTRKAVQAQVTRGVEGVRDGTIFKRTADHTCQVTILALQMSWSNKLTLNPGKAQHSACQQEVKTHVQSLFDVYGQSTKASILQRRKFQSLVIVSHTWRDALDAILLDIHDHETAELLTQMPCLQIYKYDDKNEDLIVHYGPYAYPYGFEFLDGSLITPGLPTSWKYNLFLLSCLESKTCGFIRSKDNYSRKETTLQDLARMYGQYCDTIDCRVVQPIEQLNKCVEGATQGRWWLVLTHVDRLSSQTMNMVAKAVLRCMLALPSKAHVLPGRSGAQIVLSRLPGIFFMGSSNHVKEYVPAQLAAALRTRTLGSCRPHRQIFATVQLEAMGFERSAFLAALLNCAYGLLQLLLPLPRHPCLKFNVMKEVIMEAVSIVKDLSTKAEIERAARSRPTTPSSAQVDIRPDTTTRPDSALTRVSVSTTNSTENDGFDIDIRAVALAFLRHNRRMLNAEEYLYCVDAARQVFGDTVTNFSNLALDVAPDPAFSLQVESVLNGMQQSATKMFIDKCCSLLDCLKCDNRPVVLVGPPQTGKSHCIKIVSHALTLDLKSVVRDAMPRTATKFLAPLAYFSSPTYAPFGHDSETFDQQSKVELYEYIKWFGEAPIKRNFTFNSRWLIMDCPDAQAVDGIMSCSYQRMQEMQGDPSDVRRPMLFIETCSLQNAAPSPIAMSHIVYFHSDCLGWREIFQAWTERLLLKLGERTLSVIKELVDEHVPEIINFIATQCQTVQPVSTICMIRSFCELMHYHFFLGQEVAPRRTVAFVRVVFVFAIIWSFGALLHPDSRDVFDTWLRERVEKARLLRFPYNEQEDYKHGLWEIYVSFSSMSLRAFSETDEDHNLDDNALHATETTMVVPFDRFRMTHHVWQIFHTQRQHMVLYAPDGGGKTRFLDWVFTMKDNREKGWNFAHTSMQQKRTSRQFCQWLSESLEIRPDRLFEKADFNGFFVDDVHLALESEKQPTAMAELLRSVMERKGMLNKSLIEEQNDLETVSFTMLGNIERLNEDSVRMLNHTVLVPMIMEASDMEAIAQVNVQPFERTNMIPQIRAVMNKIPSAMVEVFEWVKKNVTSEETDEIFLLWSIDHMRSTLTHLVLLPIWSMQTYDMCIRYIWHETMRVYLDRLTNLDKVRNFRSQVADIITKSLGTQYRRPVRIASESQTFHVLLPHSRVPSSAIDWDLHELDAKNLTTRALQTVALCSDIPGWITCIEDFPRHLSHVLRVYRPDYRVQGCVLVGPRGCGKMQLLQTAARMCNYDIFAEKPDTPLEWSRMELRKALTTRQLKIFVFCSNGAALNSAEFAHYLLYLIKGHGLEEFEKSGSSTVRFAFTYDIGTAVPVDVKARPLPLPLLEISKHCTVDWIKGWSDEAIMRVAKYKYEELSRNAKVDVDDELTEVMFKFHRIVEQAVSDTLTEGMAMVFPPPILINDLVTAFFCCANQRCRQSDVRREELNSALKAYEDLKANHTHLQAEHDRLIPIVQGAIKEHLQVRASFLTYSKIATRARRIAEDEEAIEVHSILYGDAPGPEIMHEYEIAKNGYLTAASAVTDLQAFHMLQFEVFEGFEELVELLVEALTILFAEEIGYDIPTLRNFAPNLQKLVKEFDVNAVGISTVKRLRAYTGDVRFTPEKYFSLNKAAGVICNWVRAVERYGRVHEWVNPASYSNQHQNLDRVREMSRNPIMALDQFEAGVAATKLRQEEALRREENARAQVQMYERQLQQSNMILSAVTPEKVDWTYKLQILDEFSATIIGDCMLYAAYVTYLVSVSHSKRRAILQLLAEVLAEAGIRTTPDFTLETFYSPLDLAVGADYMRNYSCKSLRENCLAISACPRVPLLIDPMGQGLEVLLSASSPQTLPDGNLVSANGVRSENTKALRRYSLSKCTDIKIFLEEARSHDVPALIENAEEVMEEILCVFRLHPHLVCGRANRRNLAADLDPVEVCVDLGMHYCIIISTSKKTYVPPADAFYHMSLCDLTPDSDAMQEISVQHIVRHLDVSAHSQVQEFWRINNEMKDTIRGIGQTISAMLRYENVVAQINEVKADQCVQNCKILMENRGRLQTHTLRGLDILRAVEYFDGMAQQCATTLSTSWEVCNMATVNIFGLGMFTKALSCCPSLSDLPRGSIAFKNAVEDLTENILSDMTASMLLSLPSETHHLCLLILHSSSREDDPIAKFKGALQFLSEAFNKGCLGLASSQVACTRGTGTGKLFSKLGWKVFRDSRPFFEHVYAKINNSMDYQREEWIDLITSKELKLRLPCTRAAEDENTVENLLVTLSLCPYKLSRALEQLTDREFMLARLHADEELLESAQFVDSLPSKIVCILADHHVPHWQAVVQTLLNFTLEEDSNVVGRPLVVDMFTSDEELQQILQTAANAPHWVVAKVPAGGGDWYAKLVRHMIVFEADRGLMQKSRLCVIVDAHSEAKSSGVFCDSVSVMAENSSDPRRLLGAVIADCHSRGHIPGNQFWRTAVALCYMHGMIVADLETTASCVLYDSEPVTIQPLVHISRLIASFEHYSPEQFLRITRMLVANVCYLEYFRRRNMNLLDLLDGCLSWRLYHDNDQMIILNEVIDSPDKGAQDGWKGLLKYSRTLSHMTQAPWHGKEPPCLHFDVQFERSIKSSALLERTKLESSSLPDHQAVIELANSLANVLRLKQLVRLEPQQQNLNFFEQSLRTIIEHEFDQVRESIGRVSKGLHNLLRSCSGKQPFDQDSYSLYEALSNNRVPTSWDKLYSAGMCPPRWFVEDLKMRHGYFHTQMCAYGFFRGETKRRPTTALFMHLRPQELLDLYLIAWQEAQSQSLSAQLSLPAQRLRFANVSGPPVGEKALRDLEMRKGVVVSGFVFRCVKYDARELCLGDLEHGQHSLAPVGTKAENDALFLQVVNVDELPTRGMMKRKALYWVPIPVFRQPLCPQAWRAMVSGSGDEAGGRLEFICEVYMRSKIAPDTVQRMGACAFLHAGVQERALTQGYK